MTKASKQEGLYAQVIEQYGRINYTFKTHLKDADILKEKYDILRLAQIILSSVTTAGIIGLFWTEPENNAAKILAALVSAFSTGIALYSKNVSTPELIQKHLDSANKLWLLREKYISLLTDIKGNSVDSLEIIKIREELTNEWSTINIDSPQTSDEAYKQAQNALKSDEEMFFTNDELDKMLPKHLRFSTVSSAKKTLEDDEENNVKSCG